MLISQPLRFTPPAGDDQNHAGFTLYEPQVFNHDSRESVTRIQLLVTSNRYKKIALANETKKKKCGGLIKTDSLIGC